MDTQLNYLGDNSVLDTYFLAAQPLFVLLHNKLPNYFYISNIDHEKGFACIRNNYAPQVKNQYVRTNFDCNKKKEEQTCAIVVMHQEIVIEFGDAYCDMYYSDLAAGLATEIKEKLTGFKKRARQQKHEINIISNGTDGLELLDMEVKRVKVDLEQHYNEDFAAVDAQIRKRLNTQQDKGIILLHGTPGTGKTSYLRYLVGRIKKKVIFIPPNLADRITDPEFVKLMVENPNSVLIIEDAERLITQRTAGNDSPVASLLNISDGLLSDFLNVQVICTFNCPVSMVDEALLRKGRLIARYEFGKLSPARTQALATKLGIKGLVDRSLTLAEIFNYSGDADKPAVKPAIGFRLGYMAASAV